MPLFSYQDYHMFRCSPSQATSTVLLTTHSMEEADLLGDTIGVMCKGRMQACGTSLALKREHGDGYGLNCVKSPQAPSSVSASSPEGSAESSNAAILRCVQGFVPGARLRTQVGAEVTLTLPADAAAVGAFPKLFRHFEAEVRQANQTKTAPWSVLSTLNTSSTSSQ